MSKTVVSDVDLDRQTMLTPSNDIGAEQAVLGAMLFSPAAVDEVTEVIDGSVFYRPAHAAIYEAIVALYGRGEPTDPLAVASECERRGDLGRIGGPAYLQTLMSLVASPASSTYYARILDEKAVLRRMMQAGMRITQLGTVGAEGAELVELIDQAQAELDGIKNDRTGGAGYTLFSDMRMESLAALDDVQAGRIEPGLATGFIDLDKITGGGWKPGQLIVVAGRPGTGKSTFAVDMVRNAVIRHEKTCAIFSLEMSKQEIWERIISAEAKVKLLQMKTPGALGSAEYGRIVDAHDRIDAGDGRLAIDDTPAQTVTHIRAKARRIKAKHGLDLIVVDYLQLMTSGRRVESRQVEVSEFSRQLKILAKELQVPVVALSQLNRGPEQRQDKRPMLSDLRESGALEQDSDVVVLIHRPELYEDPSPREGEADLILAKHRAGPTDTITIAQQLHFSRFVDIARQ
jgi:replicative DNA helicase